jgi:hypothetical protein
MTSQVTVPSANRSGHMCLLCILCWRYTSAWRCYPENLRGSPDYIQKLGQCFNTAPPSCHSKLCHLQRLGLISFYSTYITTSKGVIKLWGQHNKQYVFQNYKIICFVGEAPRKRVGHNVTHSRASRSTNVFSTIGTELHHIPWLPDVTSALGPNIVSQSPVIRGNRIQSYRNKIFSST